jgi:hypothetical protein
LSAAKEQLCLPTKSVLPVVSGYHNKVRDLSEVEQNAFASLAVTYVSKSYGARVTVSKEVLNECIQIFLDNFNQLGVEEIKEAYRLWSIDQLNIKGSAEMYGGEFNAAQFGKIMAAYVEYRMTILGAYLNARAIEKREKEKAEVMERRKEKNLKTFRYDWDMSDADSFQGWRDVPGWWFDIARGNGWIKLTKDQYTKIWERAQWIASLEIEKENGEETNVFKKVLGDALEQKKQARAKVIAGQIAVFEHIKKRK